MTTKELIDRYTQLYGVMKSSRDVSKMKMFGTTFTNMFNQVAEKHPEIAMATIDMLSAIEYNNYVTMAEAMEVAHDFINDDKAIMGTSQESKGPHWKADEVKAVLSSRGIPLEEKPYYNWWSLWLTINMVYSDDADTLAELLHTKDQEQLAVACYKFALRKLKDPDRLHFIREYFDL